MIGSEISHYRITAYLGGGAMGQVYKAEDMVLRRPVALKILPPYQTAGSDPAERFLREARAASALDHPSICTVYGIGRADDGLRFIAMAWCDGTSLQQVLARGTLPPERAARIALQVARGLAHAHQHGVVPRDIKPANIMITVGDGVKIVDFGLAKLADQSRLTMTGSVLGTAGYMAPEQVQSQETGAPADIWALGVVLHEMLWGGFPLPGTATWPCSSPWSTPSRGPCQTTDPTAAALAAIISRCLQKNPLHRYVSADQLIAALEVVVGSSSAAIGFVAHENVAMQGVLLQAAGDDRRQGRCGGSVVSGKGRGSSTTT